MRDRDIGRKRDVGIARGPLLLQERLFGPSAACGQSPRRTGGTRSRHVDLQTRTHPYTTMCTTRTCTRTYMDDATRWGRMASRHLVAPPSSCMRMLAAADARALTAHLKGGGAAVCRENTKEAVRQSAEQWGKFHPTSSASASQQLHSRSAAPDQT